MTRAARGSSPGGRSRAVLWLALVAAVVALAMAAAAGQLGADDARDWCDRHRCEVAARQEVTP